MVDEKALEGNPPSQKRRSRLFGQHVIKTRFQMKFALIVFAFLLAASIFIWLEGKWAVGYMLQTGAISSEDAVAHLALLNQVIGKNTILGIAAAFGLSLFFSHFIAGPIYRFERTLEEMRNGNLNVHIKLRKHDELKDVAETFNLALASLRTKFRKDRENFVGALDKAADVAQKLRKANRTSEADELEKVIEEAKSIPPEIQI